ncbi:MAG: peptidase M42, partial [Halomonas sp.]|nr:peptidase M42 [Halomonas sp.]
MTDTATPWTQPMPDAQFTLMRDILAAPSPVGLEGAMTYGVLKP